MKNIVLFLALVIVFFSCSKDDNGDTINNDTILVKRITYSDGYNDVIISYEGTKIIKMGPVEGGTTYVYFTYEGDLITKIGYSDDDNVTATEFHSYIYSNNKLVQVKVFYNDELQVVSDYTYNSDGTIEIQETGYNGNSNSSRYKNYFDGAGNLIKKEQFDNNTLTSTTNYTYDSKNNPFKNVTGYGVTGASANNLISASIQGSGGSATTSQSNTYEYDSKDFPTSCSSTRSGRNYITNYFYE